MITTVPYTRTNIHGPREHNDPFEALRVQAPPRLYSRFAMQSGHPDIISPANRNNRAVINVKPSLSIRFEEKVDEETAIIAGATNCLSHGLNRSDIGNTRPLGYTQKLMALRTEQRNNPNALRLLGEALDASGIPRILEHAVDPEKIHVLAIFLNNTDAPELWAQFDVWKKDRDGWSGKPGNYYARRTDFDGATFTNPETANLGFFGHFVGYHMVKRDGAKVETDLNLSL